MTFNSNTSVDKRKKEEEENFALSNHSVTADIYIYIKSRRKAKKCSLNLGSVLCLTVGGVLETRLQKGFGTKTMKAKEGQE